MRNIIWSSFIRPSMKMKDLNIAQIQMMEIIKAVSYNSKVIIMDEPTSSLSEKETETLFEIIDSLRKKRCWNYLYFYIVWKKYFSWQTVFLSFVTDSS